MLYPLAREKTHFSGLGAFPYSDLFYSLLSCRALNEEASAHIPSLSLPSGTSFSLVPLSFPHPRKKFSFRCPFRRLLRHTRPRFHAFPESVSPSFIALAFSLLFAFAPRLLLPSSTSCAPPLPSFPLFLLSSSLFFCLLSPLFVCSSRLSIKKAGSYLFYLFYNRGRGKE